MSVLQPVEGIPIQNTHESIPGCQVFLMVSKKHVVKTSCLSVSLETRTEFSVCKENSYCILNGFESQSL